MTQNKAEQPLEFGSEEANDILRRDRARERNESRLAEIKDTLESLKVAIEEQDELYQLLQEELEDAVDDPDEYELISDEMDGIRDDIKRMKADIKALEAERAALEGGQ